MKYNAFYVRLPNGTSGQWKRGDAMPVGTCVYMNRRNDCIEAVTVARVIDHEKALRRHNLDASVTKPRAWVDRYCALVRAVKTTKNVWVAGDKPYVYEGRSNVHALALALDGQLNIDKVLRDLPQNKSGGRPRKNASALSKQPLDIQHVPPARPLPANSIITPFVATPSSGARPDRKVKGSQPTGRQYFGKDVIIYTNNNAVHGKVMDAKRTHSGGELTYLVVFDGGQEYVTEREMILGFALYDMHLRMTTTNNTTT